MRVFPPLRRVVFGLILPLAAAFAEEAGSDYEAYTPEWFYSLAFVDASPALARRGMERFFQRDFDGASGLAVGSGVRPADQALARGAVELARGAEALLDGREDRARAAFARCAEQGEQAAAMAEDVSQNLRATVLKARCLAVEPDRAAAASALSEAAGHMADKADAAEFWYGAGNLWEDMGRRDSAERMYAAAWKIDPRGEFAKPALHSRSLMLVESGLAPEALAVVADGRRLYGGDPSLLVELQIVEGRALLLSGDTARAMFQWRSLTNAFATGAGALVPDSVQAAELYWRQGTYAAERAARLVFDDPDLDRRREAHAARREAMEEAFGFYRQAVACYSHPWTPLALRDIGAVIERYAADVASQRIDFRNDTDRVAQEVVVQRKLPSLFQSAAATYRRQIRLARATGDGLGIGLQSGHGLARAWWMSVRARRAARDLLAASPRPAADSAGAAWYARVVDSAVAAEDSAAHSTAREGLADLAQWGQGSWPEADSLRGFAGAAAAAAAETEGKARVDPVRLSESVREPPRTALQWRWKALEARRLARNTALDVRLLRARRDGN